MKVLNFKTVGATLFCLVSMVTICYSQQGSITINQDADIDRLLAIKKQMNTSESASDRYKIQVYSGNRSEAEKSRSKLRNTYNQWKTSLVYETPNYKIWVGNFRTRLEADRALKKIKSKFPSAFIFKPKKEKE
jgi:hypothetical protein